MALSPVAARLQKEKKEGEKKEKDKAGEIKKKERAVERKREGDIESETERKKVRQRDLQRLSLTLSLC